MSCIPSSSSDCQAFTSRMIFSAFSRYTLLLPTDEEGTIVPSALILVTSMMATSRGPQKPARTCGPECERWTS